MSGVAGTIFEWLGGAISTLGVIVILLGAVGQVRRPDGVRGVHFLQLILGPGAGLVLLGLALGAGDAIIALKLALLWASLSVVGPLIAGALASAAHEEVARGAARGTDQS